MSGREPTQTPGKDSSCQTPSPTLEAAKCSKSLIFRIVQHALQEGWLAPGQTVLDCFAGVGLGALPCLLHGIHFVGIELEQRFYDLVNGYDCNGTVTMGWQGTFMAAVEALPAWYLTTGDGLYYGPEGETTLGGAGWNSEAE